MAKRKKDDFSFGFSSKKEADPAPETPAEGSETPADTSSDPFASTDSSSSSDPFASTDTSSDPFASTETPTDPFASTDTSADPFASTSDTSTDPFASSDTSADASASETPAEETPAEEEAPSGPQVKHHKQFRILILADFSGRTNRGISEPASIATRKVLTVDADSLDKTIARLKPEIHLPVSADKVVPLAFKAIEDFRPDSLLARVEAFQGMLNLRQQLKDPKQFKTAAAAVRKLAGAAAPKKTKPAAAASGGGGDSDFERLLNQPIAPKNASNIDTDALIANLVAGYSVPDADPEQGKLVALIEDAISAGLRAVLRHPAFQALESAWRGVEFLVSRLNTDDDLKICVFDVSKEELYADLASQPTVQKTAMYQILVEQTRAAGGIPFSLVVGDYEFDQTPANVAVLAKVAGLMHEASIPFLASGAAKIAGYPAFNKVPDSGKWQPPADIALWDKIRAHKLASHIGLAAPRFLLRLPYGQKTDAIDTYPFEEMPSTQNPVFEGYLWGNPAFAVALLIGQAFLDAGGTDGMEPGNDVSDLPCHMAMVDGDREMTPCAQAFLSDRIGDILHKLGLIPLLSVKNAASVKVAGIHSMAKDGKALAASWAST